MKLITTLKHQWQKKALNNDVYTKSFISILIMLAVSAIIWQGGAFIVWRDYAPLLQPEKRIYVIVFLFLAWLLKLLLIDLDKPNPYKYKHRKINQRLQQIEARFRGALQFLKKTAIARNNQSERIQLKHLPWYLLVGPSGAGKTALLQQSNIKFILQKKVSITDPQASEQCDWWITRDVCIVDVPGSYVSGMELIKHGKEELNIASIAWRYFLSLIKHFFGNSGFNGIIVTLPLPEILLKNDNKQYTQLLRTLLLRLDQLKNFFPVHYPCYIVITKCDLLPGFQEFFAEAGNDETVQAWGINLPESTTYEKLHEVTSNRFDTLIKKINQQLLWRMHQERNPLARPYIKDFPLQIERIREYTLDFIKQIVSNQLPLHIKGVYLTSAEQKPSEPLVESIVEETNSKALQIMKTPPTQSRGYFIKQIFTQAIIYKEEDYKTVPQKRWQTRIAIAISLVAILGSALMMGRDFKQGVNQAYVIQNVLAEYQLALQRNQDADEHLLLTNNLLNTLKETAKEIQYQLNSPYLVAFYSYKSQQKAILIYRQALKLILIPQLKNYLEDYLRNPVNKNAEHVYAVLKAYIMLGNAENYQADFVNDTLSQILPRRLKEKRDLMTHIHFTLTSNWTPMALNQQVIQQTRRYLKAMPSFQLGYIILKNNSHIGNAFDLKTMSAPNSVFIMRQVSNDIPWMFTAQTFKKILTEETVTASNEATFGNWILGLNKENNLNPSFATTLLEQLRIAYINNYIDVWESLITNIQLTTPKNLAQLDEIVVNLMSNNSPLLQLLSTLHDNTYFEPITSSSPKLQSLGALLEKGNNSQNMLYQIFTSLQALHQYIAVVRTADNEKKAAFEAVSHRMLNPEKPDALAKLWLVAAQCPEPVKGWLNKLANTTWHFLMRDAGKYLDTSWHDKVIKPYQSEIANHYPFNAKANKEVPLTKFTQFFGKTGVLPKFYEEYLKAFIDTSNPEWHSKMMNDERVAFSPNFLKHLQQALQVNQIFFPNGSDKAYLQFTLQPYQFGKNIKSVTLTFDGKVVEDSKANAKVSHIMAWGEGNDNATRYRLSFDDKKITEKDFPGDWGLFKLVSASFDSAVNKKELVINLAEDKQNAKYLLATDGATNPFLSASWRHFILPEKLS